jgi:acetyl/propionyl-CoA carboxylase alpha subunit
MSTIVKLLVANRGEIARRIMRTARDMDIRTVAVYSDADTDGLHAGEADESVRLPGTAASDTYLRIDLIIEAARATGADAVHPGYGFLSESAEFARRCAEAGLVFVGPQPDAIAAMGSKIEAKSIMAEAGVPVLPGVTLAAHEDDEAALAEAVATVGLPALVKAAYGGGGRGMRIVHTAEQLGEAVRGARHEAQSAFGNGTVFLERFVESPRHIEVQIFGDRHGDVVHLGERECSIQRRYQKVIEESPSPAVDDALRAELGAAAIAAGKALAYEGAGTVEFVMAPDRSFYFLEVNTRLQVEHPVTELVTGIDLVRAQLLVAAGEPLPPEMTSATFTGHAVEARLYAEDPAAGFVPASGTLSAFEITESATLRVDAGFAAGCAVSTFYDPMLAKVIGYGRTRQEACARLARALDDAVVHGMATNRQLLVAILRDPEFRSGDIDTGYLERHSVASLLGGSDHRVDLIHAAVAALAAQAERRAQAPVLRGLPSGFRNVWSTDQQITFDAGENEFVVRYHVDRNTAAVTVGEGESHNVEVIEATGSRLDAVIDGVRRRYRVSRVGAIHYVQSALGVSTLTERARFPQPERAAVAGSLLAPMPGSIVRVEATVGQTVAADDPIVVLEAMKMQHIVRAPGSGVVSDIPVCAGEQVDTGTLLAVVDEAEAVCAGGDLKETGADELKEMPATPSATAR